MMSRVRALLGLLTSSGELRPCDDVAPVALILPSFPVGLATIMYDANTHPDHFPFLDRERRGRPTRSRRGSSSRAESVSCWPDPWRGSAGSRVGSSLTQRCSSSRREDPSCALPSPSSCKRVSCDLQRLMARAASQRSTARCALSQNSAELPNRRESRSAISGLPARRPRSNSFIVWRETPNASARPETVSP